MHFGHIVEKKIKLSGFSVGEVARLLAVEKRTVYNWFNSPRLSLITIERIGFTLNCDFAPEFPELFPPAHFTAQDADPNSPNHHSEILTAEEMAENVWRNKYLTLLEAYNKFQHNRNLIEMSTPVISEY
ncbi:helix-turn-helix domain-containing protein [Mucilaginibacter agri]|uniref:Uncharacterized protein n=1 Tax=Mucilaginibacter agri TaxID=2695265 RepID=A0A965ZCK6_9SPHI|nr:helix-turn-helix domain-containing protein [Mucilaginibacter agri]NCD68265.1 hypothetical protein [Mucilaginibacter agri]